MATPSTASSKIHLYTTQTPNGVKISMTLEELGLPYEVTKIDIAANTQKEPWFLAINPNGRIPALSDEWTDGKPVRVFESGSIMQYLVERYDTEYKISYPRGTREFVEMTNWLFFQNAGVGPMQGQANHFYRYAPEPIPYGINRYQNETKRLYSILDEHLANAKTPYLVGDKCTIADIAHIGWLSASLWAGVDLNEFPTLAEWEARMWARPAIEKGANTPEPYKIKEMAKDPAKAAKYAEESKRWVQEGMRKEREEVERKRREGEKI